MADFQYLPRDLIEPSIEPSKDPNILMEDCLKQNHTVPTHVPPPIFSKSDLSQSYNFDINPNFKLMETINTNGQMDKCFVSRKMRQTSESSPPIIDFSLEASPTDPPSNHCANTELVASIKLMFNDHPIWSRLALESNLPKHLLTHLTPSLHQVAYTFSNGPWRHTWVKLGYDPRTDTSSRKYQVIDFRVGENFLRGAGCGPQQLNGWMRMPTDKPRRINSSRPHINELLINPQLSEEQSRLLRNIRDAEYKFLKPPAHRQTIYMFNDLELEGLDQHLSRKPSSHCRKDSGWLQPQALRDIRKLMNSKLPKLIMDWDNGNTQLRMNEIDVHINSVPPNEKNHLDATLTTSHVDHHIVNQTNQDHYNDNLYHLQHSFSDVSNDDDESDDTKTLHKNQTVYSFLGDILRAVQDPQNINGAHCKSMISKSLSLSMDDTYNIFGDDDDDNDDENIIAYP